jgi:ribosomal-protein-alanine N-acetyltransferase
MATRQGTSTLLGPQPAYPASAGAAPVVERARFRDLLAIARLHRRCFPASLAYRPSTLLALYVWPRSRFVVARTGAGLVGCVVGDVQGGQSRVITICVDPEWRRQGIASRLLEEIESLLTAGNVILMVGTGNVGAQTLYRRRGYMPVGESRNYYGRGRHGIWMQKSRT